MARLGSFDPTARAEGWFGVDGVAEGWFDTSLIGESGIAATAQPGGPVLFANGNQGVASLGASIGAAVLFAASVFTPSVQASVPQAAAYDVGSQRAALTQGWAKVSVNQALFPVVAAQTPPLRPTLTASPQADPSQRQALLFKAPPPSAVAPDAVPQPPQVDVGSQRSLYGAGWATVFSHSAFNLEPVMPATGDVYWLHQDRQQDVRSQVFSPFRVIVPPTAPPLRPMIVGQRVERFEGSQVVWSPSFAVSVPAPPETGVPDIYPTWRRIGRR